MSEEAVSILFRQVGAAETVAAADSVSSSINRVGLAGDRQAREQLFNARQNERSFGLMERGFKGLAGTFGVVGAAFGMKDLIEAGVNLQKQQTALQEALRKTGQAGADSFKQINEAAAKSSMSGGFSRDETLQSVTQFINERKLTAQQALTMNQAAVDLARGTGDRVSFSEAQHYMGQALVGRVRALTQYVGAFTPVTTAEQALTTNHAQQIADLQNQNLPASQMRQLEINDQITKQEQQRAEMQDKLATGMKVAALVQERYGKDMERYSKTTAGMMSNLEHSFQEMAGEVGETLLPVVNTVIKGFSAAITVLLHFKAGAVALAAALTALAVVGFGRMLGEGLEYFLNSLKRTIVDMTTGKYAAMQAEAAVNSESVAYKQLSTTLAEYSALEKEVAAMQKMVTTATELNTAATTEGNAAQRVSIATLMEQRAALSAQIEELGMADIALSSTAAATEEASFMTTIWTGAIGLATTATEFLSAAWDLFWPFALLTAAIYFATHFTQSIHAMSWAWDEVKQAAGIAAQFMIHELGIAWTDIKKGVNIGLKPVETGIDRITGAIKTMIRWLENAGHKVSSFASSASHIAHAGGAFNPLNDLSALTGFFSGGGVVHEPKHLWEGGPIGTDTVPAWLTPGEGILSRQAMNVIGERGLSQLNSGMLPGGGSQNIEIHPSPAYFQIDGKTIAQAVVKYTLTKAARGTSNLTGGSLLTGTG